MLKRPSVIPLIAIFSVLALLAIGAWFYTNANDPVAGLPEVAPGEIQTAPTTKEACDEAGGAWNECASACPPGAEACIQMCVAKCEGLDDGKVAVKLYYPNSKLDPKHLDCSAVFPVRRAVEAPGDGVQAALEALLNGPTDAEKEAGFFTSIPEGTKLISYTADSDDPTSVRVVFSTALDRGIGGSCRVTSIRAEIERTIKDAWPKITSIEIVAQGKKSEETLQP